MIFLYIGGLQDSRKPAGGFKGEFFKKDLLRKESFVKKTLFKLKESFVKKTLVVFTAGVPEWSNGTDSRSVSLVLTKVRILSPA